MMFRCSSEGQPVGLGGLFHCVRLLLTERLSPQSRVNVRCYLSLIAPLRPSRTYTVQSNVSAYKDLRQEPVKNLEGITSR